MHLHRGEALPALCGCRCVAIFTLFICHPGSNFLDVRVLYLSSSVLILFIHNLKIHPGTFS